MSEPASSSRANSRDQARQSFADQFEQAGGYYIYRRSQKGEALRVSAEERDRFLEEFNRNYRRGLWMMYIGLTAVLGLVIGWSVYRGGDLSQGAIFAAIALAIVPYLAYVKWTWGAPARELAGRTPVAAARSTDEVRRRQFQRITYGQLATVAVFGVMLPFMLSSRHDLLSGWNRLWLALGGGLILLAAVQAFRKWRVEQQGSYEYAMAAPRAGVITQTSDETTSERPAQYRRYLILAAIAVMAAVLFLTPAGKRVVASPSFFPVLIVGCGAWALFTVAKGFSKGQIQPFLRGFYNTYERKAEPRRFWASMAWNGTFGCFCLGIAIPMLWQAQAQAMESRCYNASSTYSPQAALSACNELVDKRKTRKDAPLADALMARGNAHYLLRQLADAIADYSEALRIMPGSTSLLENRGAAYFLRGDAGGAIADYSQMIHLQPKDAQAYYDRGLTYEQLLHDPEHAIPDYSAAIRLKPGDAYALYHRGFCYGNVGDYQRAISDFSDVIRLMPNSASAYYFRGVGYHDIGNDERAAADRATALRLDPQLLVKLRNARNSRIQ